MKILTFFLRLYCLAIPGRDLSTKKTKPKNRNMTRKRLSQVRILLYRTWPFCVAELLNARQQRLLENRESVRIGGGCFRNSIHLHI